jgi:hypothetical protein
MERVPLLYILFHLLNRILIVAHATQISTRAMELNAKFVRNKMEGVKITKLLLFIMLSFKNECHYHTNS